MGPEFIGGGTSTAPIVYPVTYYSYLSNAKVWDIPLLLKYRIGSRRFRPFVDAGVTFSHTSTDSTITQMCLSSSDVCANTPFTVYNAVTHNTIAQNSTGPTAGIGVEFKIGKFNLSPEVR